MGSLEGRFALYEMCWNALNAAILSLFNLVCVTSAEAVTLKPSFVMAIDLYLHYGVGEKGEAYQVAKDPAWRAQLWEKDFHVSMFETFYFALGSAWQAGNVFAKDTLLFVRSVLFRLQVRHTELARTWAEQFAKHKTLFTLESAFEAKARDFLDLHSDLSGEAQLKAAIDDLMALLVYEGQELPREWSALFEIGNRAFTSPLAAEESSNHFVRNLAEAAKNYSPNDFKLRVKVGELIGLYERLNKVMAVEFLKPYAEELKIALERYVLNLRARPELMKDFDTSVFPDDSSSTIQVMFAILSKDAMLDPLSDLESLMKRFLSIIPVLMLPQGKFQTEHVLA
ncbi:MAG: hypothetical protein EBX40_06460, partial [Gammaproteobacteria bacterium]|nr:hypothetical protein [Gammaproteobacteria bacterium]